MNQNSKAWLEGPGEAGQKGRRAKQRRKGRGGRGGGEKEKRRQEGKEKGMIMMVDCDSLVDAGLVTPP